MYLYNVFQKSVQTTSIVKVRLQNPERLECRPTLDVKWAQITPSDTCTYNGICTCVCQFHYLNFSEDS